MNPQSKVGVDAFLDAAVHGDGGMAENIAAFMAQHRRPEGQQEHVREIRVTIDPACDSWAVVNDCGTYIELAYRGQVFIVQKGYLVERSSAAGGGLAFLPPQIVGLKAVEQ